MRKLLTAILGLAALAATAVASQTRQSAPIEGEWVDTGDFFQPDLRKVNGVLACTLRISAKGTSSGSIGGVNLEDVRVHEGGTYLQVSARLPQPVSPTLRTKEHVLFVITLLNDSTMHGEFHLKSNRVYDIRMREGELAMHRVR